MNTLAPGSTILNRELGQHRFSNETFEIGSGAVEFALSIHPFKRPNAPGPELRVGLCYAGTMNRSATLQRTIREPYDTLTSSQTGEQFLVDSVFRDRIWLDHSAERMGVSASLIWRTRGRWSLYGGVGFAGGPLLNARTEVRWTVSNTVEPHRDTADEEPYFGFNGEDGTDEVLEAYRNGNGWWLATNLPIGLDFQLARRGLFFSRLHLFNEVRPQMVVQGTRESGTSSSFGAQSVFGLRLCL